MVQSENIFWWCYVAINRENWLNKAYLKMHKYIMQKVLATVFKSNWLNPKNIVRNVKSALQ